MLIQNIHIREILIDQALYYFYIFNKIFMTWYKEKETEKLVKEEEKEREKQIQKYHVTLPPILFSYDPSGMTDKGLPAVFFF